MSTDQAPPDRLAQLEFLERVQLQDLARTRHWIEDEKRRRAERARGRADRPEPPDWLLELGLAGRSAIYVLLRTTQRSLLAVFLSRRRRELAWLCQCLRMSFRDDCGSHYRGEVVEGEEFVLVVGDLLDGLGPLRPVGLREVLHGFAGARSPHPTSSPWSVRAPSSRAASSSSESRPRQPDSPRHQPHRATEKRTIQCPNPPPLTEFIRAYEQATNSHDITQLVPLIAPEAVYWFSDGSHHGREAILAAIAETFATIRDEIYQINDLEWIARSDDHAICRYRFTWTGTIDAQPRSGSGRGTNVLVNATGTWQMLHEHLSA